MSFDPISYLKAKEAKELADNIVDGEVDKGVLRTNIDQKLNDLEVEYAPKLTEVATQLAETMNIDYLIFLREQNSSSERVFAELLGDRSIKVGIPINDKIAYYVFNKDNNDDHIKLDGAGVATKILKKNFETKTGVYSEAQAPNIFTTEVGATFSFSFEGTGFIFQHYADNRGGVWEFDVSGMKKTISTHIDSIPPEEIIAGKPTRPVFIDLDFGEYEVVATFKGDDPSHEPSGGTSRGWVYKTNTKDDRYEFYTAQILGTDAIYDTKMIDDFEVIQRQSNVEFAFSLRPKGSSESYSWIPEHGATGTLFAVEQVISLDSDVVTDFTVKYKTYSVKRISIYQKSKGYHPSDMENPVTEFTTIYTITNKGININYKTEFLKDVEFESGYTMMLPLNGDFMDVFYANSGDFVKKIVGSKQQTTNLTDSNSATSFLVTNNTDSKKRNYAVALGFNDIVNTLRKREEGVADPLYRVQHRVDGLQKFYPNVFKTVEINAGYVYKSKADLFIGEAVNVDNLL